MVNILLITDDTELNKRLRNVIQDKFYNFSTCNTETSIFDLIEAEPPDLFIFDRKISFQNLQLLIKKIKSKLENAQIILYQPEVLDNTNNEHERLFDGFLFDFYTDSQICTILNSYAYTKNKIDKLSVRNKDMAESLYRLNVLYNTSSQFAGTLDSKELINYMLEGLDKSLSYDLTSTISFGFENEPVLLISSLYDVSEELANALKLRAILNYKSLFNNKEIPFEIDDRNLKIIKNIKNPHEKFNFEIFRYDSMFAPIDLGDQFFGCIEIFKKKTFTSDDSAYFQTLVRQVSLPLKSAGLYRKITEKNYELEKLERVKSDFISIVSHELRTPLTPIKNALTILSGGRCGELSENAAKFVDMAKRNVLNLTNIINDILDINKIEAGKMVFNYETINIHSIIENIKNAFECVAKENNIAFKAYEQENLPPIYADNQRLEQVLRNLVSNAIKFTPSGKSITITSELKNADDIVTHECFKSETENLSGEYIIVSVIDEGIGIKEENLIKAFEQFTQIENSLTRKVGGTGLGLPIAKQLIKAHKGAIWCDSKEDVGSSFHFAIPVCAQQTECKSIQKELI